MTSAKNAFKSNKAMRQEPTLGEPGQCEVDDAGLYALGGHRMLRPQQSEHGVLAVCAAHQHVAPVQVPVLKQQPLFCHSQTVRHLSQHALGLRYRVKL